ncbi:MAG: YCF48-related protein, partial [Acidobacteriota bacterium]|nr:YCF48-related protein [Acidobacteriota bacterium]
MIWKKIAFFYTFAFLAAVPAFYAQSGWNQINNGATSDLVAVYFMSAERGFVAGDKGYLAQTSDAGRTWTRQLIDADEGINEIYFRNDRNGYVVAGKKMFLTDDGGRLWREIKIYDPESFRTAAPEFLSVRFADKKRGLIIGSLLNKEDEVIDSLVMRTDNGGETWSRVIVPSKLELFHLDFAGSSRGWIVGDKGLILTTQDGGLSWQKQISGVDKTLYNVDFRDSEEGYAVGGKGTILRTENGGETWESVKTSFSSTFLRVDFADDKNGWIVGYGGTILRSSDKGRTWLKQESNTK